MVHSPSPVHLLCLVVKKFYLLVTKIFGKLSYFLHGTEGKNENLKIPRMNYIKSSKHVKTFFFFADSPHYTKFKRWGTYINTNKIHTNVIYANPLKKKGFTDH